jgi:hypothetical protein
VEVKEAVLVVANMGPVVVVGEIPHDDAGKTAK